MKQFFVGILLLAVCLTLTGVPAQAVQKEWTLLVYMDGDNNLEPDSIKDFLEMATVGTNDKLNIVVQYDRVPGFSTAYGDWKDCRRFLIQKGDNPTVTPLQNLGEANMGSKTVFQDFITWGITNYPAKHYLLVAWNHGGGWRSRTRTAGAVHKAICWDDTNNGDCLYMKDFQAAVRGAEQATSTKVDIIGFDACLMGMIEIATDMKDLGNYMIGSEELEPGSGWPYDRILAALNADPTMTPALLATTIVDAYADSYKGQDATVTQAAIDLSKISALNATIRNFVQVANQWSKLTTARTATRTYSEADGYPHADLYHFMNNIAVKGVTDPAVLAAATSVKTALRAAVLNTRAGTQRTNSNGLAIFFPKTRVDYDNADGADYPTHDFNIATGWNDFLKKFFTPPADNTGGGSSEPIADGSGTATLSRAITNPLLPGATLRSVTLTYKATQDLSGGQITITIPAGWPKPTTTAGPGQVVLTRGTGVTATMTISGNQVIINTTALIKGQTIKIAYKNSVAPKTAGNYTFTVNTRGRTGSLRPLAAQPYLVVAR